jgi:hypothetical protein
MQTPARHTTHARLVTDSAAYRIHGGYIMHVRENSLRSFENFIYIFVLTSDENKQYHTTT